MPKKEKKSGHIKLSKKKINKAISNLKSNPKEHEESFLEKALEEEKLKEVSEEIDDNNLQEDINSERLQEFLSAQGRSFSPQGQLENIFTPGSNVELEIAAMRKFNAEDEKDEKEKNDPMRYHVTGDEKYHTSGDKLYQESTQRQYEEPGQESERDKVKFNKENADERMRSV